MYLFAKLTPGERLAAEQARLTGGGKNTIGARVKANSARWRVRRAAVSRCLSLEVVKRIV